MEFSFYFIVIFLFLRRINGAVRDVAVVDALVHCPDTIPLDQFEMSNISLTTVSPGEVRINGEGHLGGIGIPDLEKVVILAYECNSKQDMNNCEKVTEFPFQNGCSQIVKEGHVWSSFFRNIEPKLQCPIKGVYHIKDAYADPVMINKYLPRLKGAYWKIRIEVSYKNELRACFQIHIFIQSLVDRKKNKG